MKFDAREPNHLKSKTTSRAGQNLNEETGAPIPLDKHPCDCEWHFHGDIIAGDF
jgi:hypothetical protein